MDMIRVAARSRPRAVAGAIAGMIREGKEVSLRAIGATAVNQAVKAVAVARSYLESDGIGMGCIPKFQDIFVGDNLERTAIVLTVIRLPGPGCPIPAAGELPAGGRALSGNHRPAPTAGQEQ